MRVLRKDGHRRAAAHHPLIELQKRRVRDATCVLSTDVRGGSWYWSGAQSAVSQYEADVQEQLAWEHIGATPRDFGASITAAKESLTELEEKHGGPDPKIWKWGVGTPCADVSAADDALRRHRDIAEKIAAYERLLAMRVAFYKLIDLIRKADLDEDVKIDSADCVCYTLSRSWHGISGWLN